MKYLCVNKSVISHTRLELELERVHVSKALFTTKKKPTSCGNSPRERPNEALRYLVRPSTFLISARMALSTFFCSWAFSAGYCFFSTLSPKNASSLVAFLTAGLAK